MGEGSDLLLRNLEHTRAGNDLLLSLARIAQRRGHSLRWLSALDARLYYEVEDRQRSFQPDGRGVDRAVGRHYEFAVEIDRSPMAQAKFNTMLEHYDGFMRTNRSLGEGTAVLRVLVITSSWGRAKHLARMTYRVAPDLPFWFTTWDRLAASGADSPI